MRPPEDVTFDPLLGRKNADAIASLAGRWGSCKTCAAEPARALTVAGAYVRFPAAEDA